MEPLRDRNRIGSPRGSQPRDQDQDQDQDHGQVRMSAAVRLIREQDSRVVDFESWSSKQVTSNYNPRPSKSISSTELFVVWLGFGDARVTKRYKETARDHCR